MLRYSLMCSLALTLAASLRASELSPGWYGAVSARGNFIEDTHLTQLGFFNGGNDVSFDPGIAFSARGGYRFCQYFSLEGEMGFTGNSIDHISGTSVDADFFQIPFMANAVFSFPVRYNISPYFGAGMGGTTSIIDANHIHVFNTGDDIFGDDSTTTFCYQFFAGIHFAINERISVGVVYSYRAVDGPRFDEDFPIEFHDLKNHSIGVSANFRF